MLRRFTCALIAVYVLFGAQQSWAARAPASALCPLVTMPTSEADYSVFKLWTLEDFITRNNTDILLSAKVCPTMPQRISVTTTDTPPLYARILELARGEKFVKRAEAKNAMQVMEERRFNQGMPHAEPDTLNQRDKNRIRKHNMRFQALLEQVDEVEVGAWDFTLENGEHRVAIFTSADVHKVDEVANENSLRGILATIPQGVRIKQMQFIHNHPTSVSLSGQDQVMMMWAKDYVQRLGYGRIRMQMTAIHQMDDVVIAMTIAL